MKKMKMKWWQVEVDGNDCGMVLANTAQEASMRAVVYYLGVKWSNQNVFNVEVRMDGGSLVVSFAVRVEWEPRFHSIIQGSFSSDTEEVTR